MGISTLLFSIEYYRELIKVNENYRNIIAGVSILLFITLFLYKTHQFLSPILIGIFLIFLLLGLKELQIAKRLIICTTFILLIWFFAEARTVFFPFFISFALAYLFDPVADWMESKRMPRTAAVLLLFVFTIGILVIIGVILIPSLVVEVQELISKVPELALRLTDLVKKSLPHVLNFLNIDYDEFQRSVIDQIPKRAEVVLYNILKGITSIGSFLGQIFNLILIPILTFYFLKDFNKLSEWTFDFVPKRFRNIYIFYRWRVNRILGGYLRGQIIVCTIVGLLTGIGLSILRIPFAILVGVMTGILNIIPYIGLYVSLALALLTGFLTPEPLIAMIKIGVVFLLVQGLEAYVISPKIVGERVGLHPLAVIFSVLIFSRFLGFWGLIIGVPTAAVIKFMVDEWKRRQKWREILGERSGAGSR